MLCLHERAVVEALLQSQARARLYFSQRYAQRASEVKCSDQVKQTLGVLNSKTRNKTETVRQNKTKNVEATVAPFAPLANSFPSPVRFLPVHPEHDGSVVNDPFFCRQGRPLAVAEPRTPARPRFCAAPPERHAGDDRNRRPLDLSFRYHGLLPSPEAKIRKRKVKKQEGGLLKRPFVVSPIRSPYRSLRRKT